MRGDFEVNFYMQINLGERKSIGRSYHLHSHSIGRLLFLRHFVIGNLAIDYELSKG